MDRRNDQLLRDIVHRCQRDLERHGFRLEGRGKSDEHSWVKFRRPVREPGGHHGTLVLLMAHGARERALLVDSYFVDTTLDIHTPHRKLLHRYAEEAELPHVIREVVDTLRSWSS